MGEYTIPSIVIQEGDFVRIWINKVPRKQKSFASLIKHLTEEVSRGQKGLRSNDYSLRIFNRHRLSPVDRSKQISVSDYILKYSGRSLPKETLEELDFNAEWKVQRLGFAHRKLLEIVVAFLSNDLLMFDYYGFSPETEQRLTHFLTRRKENRTIIAFDDLNYFDGSASCSTIRDVTIDLTRKIASSKA